MNFYLTFYLEGRWDRAILNSDCGLESFNTNIGDLLLFTLISNIEFEDCCFPLTWNIPYATNLDIRVFINFAFVKKQSLEVEIVKHLLELVLFFIYSELKIIDLPLEGGLFYTSFILGDDSYWLFSA